jgi:dTMP kinase
LGDWLEKAGVEVVAFRDPGTTAIGEKIRQILLAPEHDVMSTRTELLLYMAARAQLWAERIAPALKADKCVVLDRWLSSTCAYQGCAGGFGMDKVIRIAEDSLERPWPDLTIVLDVDLETSANRLSTAPDRMEAKPRQYHQKVRHGFLALAERRKNFFVVDAAQEIEAVHKEIVRIVRERF